MAITALEKLERHRVAAAKKEAELRKKIGKEVQRIQIIIGRYFFDVKASKFSVNTESIPNFQSLVLRIYSELAKADKILFEKYFPNELNDEKKEMIEDTILKKE